MRGMVKCANFGIGGMCGHLGRAHIPNAVRMSEDLSKCAGQIKDVQVFFQSDRILVAETVLLHCGECARQSAVAWAQGDITELRIAPISILKFFHSSFCFYLQLHYAVIMY